MKFLKNLQSLKRLLLTGAAVIFFFDAAAVTNDWTKSTSGTWQEPYWSEGPPNASQELVAIRNPGWKAVSIDVTTTGGTSGPNLSNLLVEAPVDSFNQLLLNWAGLGAPLTINSNLTIGLRGSLASHSSKVIAPKVLLSGSMSLADASVALLGEVTLEGEANLSLENASLSCSNLVFMVGTFHHNAGSHVVNEISLPWSPVLYYGPASGSYLLNDGTLVTSNVVIGPPKLYGYGRTGSFAQAGGVHTNNALSVQGWVESTRYGYAIHRSGVYELTGGLLQSSNINIYAGLFSQSGGTNRAQTLSVTGGGLYTLNSGELTAFLTKLTQTEQTSVYFMQSGGVHTVQSSLILEDPAFPSSYEPATMQYLLDEGTLNAEVIELGRGALFSVLGGSINNPGLIAIRGGKLQVGNVLGLQLGKLSASNAVVDIDPSLAQGPTLLKFQDSRSVAWPGGLLVYNWHHAYDHIFVGTNAQGLTASQLSQITFFQPVGWPNGSYPATLLPNGELVPAGAGMSNGFTYMVTGGVAVITGYTGPDKSIAIPITIDGYPVRQIGDNAFRESGALTNLIIPGVVTNIGRAAFYSCTNLTTVSLAPGLLSISDDAFSRCAFANLVLPDTVITVGSYAFLNCSNLASIVLSTNLTELAYGVLEYCGALTNLTVPPNVTNIDVFALGFCTSLKSITIPDGVLSIGDLALFGCMSLTNVGIPASVLDLGLDAFGLCTSLLDITVDPLNPAYRTVNGVLFDKSGTTLLKYPLGRSGSYAVPNGVNVVYNWVFEYSSNLTSVVIPASVTNIAYSTFSDCPNLSGLYFYGDAPSFGYNTFYDSPKVVLYYLPGTSGWAPTMAGAPTAPWILPQPLILGSGTNFGLHGDLFSFVITWASNATVVVEASSNLVNPVWSPVRTNTLSEGWALFSEPRSTNPPHKFYRVRRL